MSHALAQNLISSTVHNRSRNSDYYRGRKNNTPELLQNRIARRVNNGSLKLLLQITDQAGMPVFIESQLSGDSLELQENDAYSTGGGDTCRSRRCGGFRVPG